IGLDDQSAAEFLHHHHRFEWATAESAMLFRQGRGEKAKLRELGPMLRIAARIATRELAPVFVFVIVGEIALHRIAQQRLFLGESEVHWRSFRRVSARSIR